MTPPWDIFIGISLLDLAIHLAIPIGLLLAGYGLSELIQRVTTWVCLKRTGEKEQ